MYLKSAESITMQHFVDHDEQECPCLLANSIWLSWIQPYYPLQIMLLCVPSYRKRRKQLAGKQWSESEREDLGQISALAFSYPILKTKWEGFVALFQTYLEVQRGNLISNLD